jgi:predicted RNase H-like HicB family nuclease
MESQRNVPMHSYKINIFWSNEDEVFIADILELPGCKAHGDTPQDALTHAREAVDIWVDTAQEFGDSVPEPKGRRLVYA